MNIIIIIILVYSIILFNINDKLSNFDRLVVNLSLSNIILLFFSILTNNIILKDISHVIITIITIIFSFNLKSKKLIKLNILSILITIYFWISINQCPIGHYNNFYLDQFVKYLDRLKLSYPILIIPLINLFYKLVR